MNQLVKEAKALEPELIANRRYLHAHPECGYELTKTCAFVMKELQSYGYEPVYLCESGIVATVGKTNGKTILLRADMDALPLTETTDLPFCATNGNAHACGHDLHTAMLLGAAKLLKQHESELNGCVKLMFQPDEEGTSPQGISGADKMLAAGVLENPKVDVVFSMHVMSGAYPSGTIHTRKGPLMSSCDNVEIMIQGKGTHGSQPQNGVDPINIAMHIYQGLQNLIARELDPAQQAVLTIGSINGGEAGNVIADSVRMRGTLRTTMETTRTYFKERITSIVTNSAQMFNGQGEVAFLHGIPSVYNAPDLTADVMRYANALFDEPVYEMADPMSGSDDISVLSQAVPTCYVMLGGGTAEEGYHYAHHNPNILFNETIMYKGTALYAQIALEWLKHNV